MANKKRSERFVDDGATVGVATRSASDSLARNGHRQGRSIVSAFCPVCARTVPEKRATKRTPLGASETKPYFDSIEWRPDQPFGLRHSAAGKASFKDWSYINPDDAPELFEAMKGRFLEAVKEWIAKGWISEGDVLATLGETRRLITPAPARRQNGKNGNGNGRSGADA